MEGLADRDLPLHDFGRHQVQADHAGDDGPDQRGDKQRHDAAVAEVAQPEHHDQTQDGVQMQDVADPEDAGVQRADGEQHQQPSQVHAAGTRRVLLLHVRELDRETQAEEQAEDAVELAGEEQVAHMFGHLVDLTRPHVRAVGLGKHRGTEARHVHDQNAHQRKAAQDVQRGQAFVAGQGARGLGCRHVSSRQGVTKAPDAARVCPGCIAPMRGLSSLCPGNFMLVVDRGLCTLLALCDQRR